MKLSKEQLQRYNRNISLPEIKATGQKKLLNSRVVIIGIGGLGSAVGYYLTAVGIGRLILIDNDIVELSNLQRQISHNNKTLGIDKVKSAKNTFKALNPDIKIITIKDKITDNNINNIEELIKDCDVVAECSDNFETKYFINEYCVKTSKPFVIGSVQGFEGHITSVVLPDGHCYRCLFSDLPPKKLNNGIVGAVAGVIGSLQAMEIIKLILNKGEGLKNRFLIYDGVKTKFREITVLKQKDCPVCSRPK